MRFMNAPPPSRAEYCCQLSFNRGELTIRPRKGSAITPATGRELCVTPIEQPTLGLGQLHERRRAYLAWMKLASVGLEG